MACGLSFLAYGLNQVDWSNLVLAVVLAIIIILTCTMNYLHDRSASNVMKSIKSMLPADCMVVRDGKQIKTAAANVSSQREGRGRQADQDRRSQSKQPEGGERTASRSRPPQPK